MVEAIELRSYGGRATLLDLLDQGSSAQASADLVFTSDGAQATATWTKPDLSRSAQAMAMRLLTQADPGDRALLCLPTSPEFFTAFFGCVYAGLVPAVTQVIRNSQHLRQIERMAHECAASLILLPRPVADRTDALDPGFFRRTGLQPVIVDGLDAPPAEANTTESLSIRRPLPSDLAYLQFTSGSTGDPRGVMVSHANVLNNVRVLDEKSAHPREGSAVSWLPLYHDMGLVSVFYALWSGLRLVLLSPMHFMQQPSRWLRAISTYRGVYSGGPNFAYELCTEAALPEEDLDLSSWQWAFCGAEMVRPATLRRFLNRFEPFGLRPGAISPGYGLAESTLIVSGVVSGHIGEVRRLAIDDLAFGGTARPAAENQASTEVSDCGPPGAGHRICIVDPERQSALEDGRVGEIWISGPSVAMGYWQRPDESNSVFEARLAGEEGTWLRTGDLGFLDHGSLFVTGRIKELVIIRGRNYHPRDIEEAASDAHPSLSGTGSAFVTLRDGEESLVVVLEVRRTRRHEELDAVLAAVQEQLVRRLEIRADSIALVKPGTIPRTTSGKIQRLKCREQYQRGQMEFLAFWQTSGAGAQPGEILASAAAQDSAEQVRDRLWILNWMSQWLSVRLHIPRHEIDADRSFSSYGLDSLAAVELTQAIREWAKVPVSETLSWSYPTPAELSAYLEQVLRQQPESSPFEWRFLSEVDVAVEWVERLSEPEVDSLYRNWVVRE